MFVFISLIFTLVFIVSSSYLLWSVLFFSLFLVLLVLRLDCLFEMFLVSWGWPMMLWTSLVGLLLLCPINLGLLCIYFHLLPGRSQITFYLACLPTFLLCNMIFYLLRPISEKPSTLWIFFSSLPSLFKQSWQLNFLDFYGILSLPVIVYAMRIFISLSIHQYTVCSSIFYEFLADCNYIVKIFIWPRIHKNLGLW